jgi:hypothetical protein
MNRLIPIGSLMLASGLVLHNWMHLRYSEFAGGFLIGMSCVFLIAGFIAQTRVRLK